MQDEYITVIKFCCLLVGATQLSAKNLPVTLQVCSVVVRLLDNCHWTTVSMLQRRCRVSAFFRIFAGKILIYKTEGFKKWCEQPTWAKDGQ